MVRKWSVPKLGRAHPKADPGAEARDYQRTGQIRVIRPRQLSAGPNTKYNGLRSQLRVAGFDGYAA